MMLFEEVASANLGDLQNWLSETSMVVARARDRELLAGRADPALRELQFELHELAWDAAFEMRIRREVRRWVSETSFSGR